MIYKNEEFCQNGTNRNFAIICLIGYHYGSKYTQIYGKSIKMGMGIPKQNLFRYSLGIGRYQL
jgi:hypothetical protein